MILHLLYRLERAVDLAPLLTASDTVILMSDTWVHDFDAISNDTGCTVKVLSDSSSRSARTITTADWVALTQAHRHCVSWD